MYCRDTVHTASQGVLYRGANFGAVNFGKLSDMNDYVLNLGPEIRISQPFVDFNYTNNVLNE